MSEQRFDVKVYGVNYLCACGTPVVYDNFFHSSNPPQYKHRCPRCRAVVTLGDKYPALRFEPK